MRQFVMKRRVWVIGIAVVGLVVAACGGGGGSDSGGGSVSPTATPAQAPPATLSIDAPKEGDIIRGTEVVVKVRVTSVKLDASSIGRANKTGTGHLNFSLDGNSIQRTANTELKLTGLTSGPHTVVVELNNNDQTALTPPVQARVNFQYTAPVAQGQTPSAPAATPPPGEAKLGIIDTPPSGNLGVGTRIGRLAPNFRLRSPDGTILELAQFRGKKPVFVNFWATWCGPCRFEMPQIQKLHERLGDKLQVIGVDLDESNGAVVNFFKDLGLSFTAVVDKGQKVADEYRLLGLPSTFVVDMDGVVRAVKFGPFADGNDINKSLASIGL